MERPTRANAGCCLGRVCSITGFAPMGCRVPSIFCRGLLRNPRLKHAPDHFEAVGRDMLRRIPGCMPVWVVQIDNVYRRNARLNERFPGFPLVLRNWRLPVSGHRQQADPTGG